MYFGTASLQPGLQETGNVRLSAVICHAMPRCAPLGSNGHFHCCSGLRSLPEAQGSHP